MKRILITLVAAVILAAPAQAFVPVELTKTEAVTMEIRGFFLNLGNTIATKWHAFADEAAEHAAETRDGIERDFDKVGKVCVKVNTAIKKAVVKTGAEIKEATKPFIFESGSDRPLNW
jgi:hypothetical protein